MILKITTGLLVKMVKRQKMRLVRFLVPKNKFGKLETKDSMAHTM